MNLHSKIFTGEPHLLFGMVKFSKRPIVKVFKSTIAKKVMWFLDSFSFFDMEYRNKPGTIMTAPHIKPVPETMQETKIWNTT